MKTCHKCGSTLEPFELCKLRDENAKLKGIIARSVMQRLQEDVAHITPQDIQDSLNILYAWQKKGKE